VWQTDLVNPDFAAYAELCGGRGFRAETPEELQDAIEAALVVEDGPSMLEIRVSPRWV
jgi:thiamine pyrophosphate-dependent acetolactate synthase large subunit-like protein